MSIIKTNKFGDYQYDGQNLPNIMEIDPTKIWTIKNPTQTVIDYLYNYEQREYNSVNYILSPKASEVIPYPNQEYNGCACIIYTDDHVILVADNKPYMQNVQGMKSKNETRSIDTIMRKINEEIGLDMKYYRFVKIGEWSFNNVVDLVDSVFESKTIVYSLRLVLKEIAKFDEITHVDNDEIQFVAKIPISAIADYPNMIQDKTFAGHHRQALYDFFEIDKKENISYLRNYHIWGRYKKQKQ